MGIQLSGLVRKDRLPLGSLWKESLRKVSVPHFLRIMTLRQRQACDRLIYCSENLFLLTLFISTVLTFSVREIVQSPYKATTLNGNQILRSRTTSRHDLRVGEEDGGGNDMVCS